MSKILVAGIEIPDEGNETVIRIQPDGSVLDVHGIELDAIALDVNKLTQEQIEYRNRKVSRTIQELKWRDIFADLVRVAVDKGYYPDEVRENPAAFEDAYQLFFDKKAGLFEV